MPQNFSTIKMVLTSLRMSSEGGREMHVEICAMVTIMFDYLAKLRPNTKHIMIVHHKRTIVGFLQDKHPTLERC